MTILDSNGNPLRRGRIYNLRVEGIEEVKVVDFSTQKCFEDHCNMDICYNYGTGTSYILLKLIKGCRENGKTGLWVFHLSGFDLIDWAQEGWNPINCAETKWFDIWEPR